MKKLVGLMVGLCCSTAAFAQTTVVCGPTMLQYQSNMVVIGTEGWPNGCPGFAKPNMANIWRNVSADPVGTVIRVCSNMQRLTSNWQFIAQRNEIGVCQGYASSANGLPVSNVYYYKRIY